MKKIAIRFAILGMLLVVAGQLFLWPQFVAGQRSLLTLELARYIILFIALLTIPWGIWLFRKKENRGQLSFAQGMVLGILITLGPAITYALADLIYALYIDPLFFDRYYTELETTLSKESNGMLDAEALNQLEKRKALLGQPVVYAVLQWLTVLFWGLILSILFSMYLRKPPRIHEKIPAF